YCRRAISGRSDRMVRANRATQKLCADVILAGLEGDTDAAKLWLRLVVERDAGPKEVGYGEAEASIQLAREAGAETWRNWLKLMVVHPLAKQLEQPGAA